MPTRNVDDVIAAFIAGDIPVERTPRQQSVGRKNKGFAPIACKAGASQAQLDENLARARIKWQGRLPRSGAPSPPKGR